MSFVYTTDTWYSFNLETDHCDTGDKTVTHSAFIVPSFNLTSLCQKQQIKISKHNENENLHLK